MLITVFALLRRASLGFMHYRSFTYVVIVNWFTVHNLRVSLMTLFSPQFFSAYRDETIFFFSIIYLVNYIENM